MFVKKLVLLVLFAVAAPTLVAQRAIVVADMTISHGETGCVAVALQSLGDENAIAFSLCFDTNLLTYVSATRGADAGGATFIPNALQAASGRVGMFVGLSTEEVFAAGSNHIVQVCFRARAGIPGTNTMIRICDEPLTREIADVTAETLSADYADGTVSIGGICTYALEDDSAEISSAGGHASVSIVTGPTCPWTVTNANSWIAFETSSGTGGEAIGYVVEPNPVSTARTGIVDIAGQRLTIVQVAAPCSFQLSPTMRVHDHLSVGVTFDVLTFDNCDWVVINTNSWILIKLFTNGTGSGMVRYTVLANADPHPRTGSIVVGGEAFTVFQLAAPCTYSLLPTNRIVSASGANGQISIFTPTDCPWAVVNTNQWITLNGPTSGSGNAVFDYTVAPRFATGERTGVITVGGRRFTITQLGTPCTYSISPTSRSHSSGRATNTITVNTNLIETCATLMWTATTTNQWIRILGGASGIGRGTVRYAISNHTLGGTRVGSILVADRLFTITQSGQPCNFSRSPSSRSHTYLAETGFVNISAFTGCVWTATANQPWVTITSPPGSGNGIVTYQLQTNTGSSRSATINVGGMSFSISQSAATAPSISTQPANVSVLVGATAVFNVTASGTAPLSYQWQFNGVNIDDGPGITGSTTSRLTLSDVQPEQSGDYTVIVGNVRGSVTSSVRTLRVNTSPVMPPIPPKIANRGTLLAFKPVVIDNDIPPQTMTYSLLSGPSGATINSSSGLFVWTPGTSQAIGTNLARIRVLDNGSPALSATQTVTISVISAPTTNVSLISTSVVWNYRDTGEDLGTAWTSPLFDDGLWRSGPAPLGYGLSSLRTIVGFGPNSSSRYITTYFRQRFFIADPQNYTALNLRVRRDDGVVVYLNGTEIHRNNMPSGPIGYRTVASSSASSATAYSTSAADASALISGLNVIAAEIHQQSAGSSDIAFDLGLEGIKTFTAPSIATHPSSQTLPEGAAVQFAVAASGLLPMEYQWYYNGEPLPGETSSTLAMSDLETTQSGEYFVIVNNTSGAATSSIVRLTVFKVINLPPVLAVITDKTVAEGNLLTFTATATDSNLPNQRLTFSLAPGAPSDCTIHPDSGVLNWTPGELEGGQTFDVTVRVQDNGDPPAGDSKSFTITVLDTNNAPVLTSIGNKTAVENTLLSFTASATDSDFPAQTLSFSLVSAPSGATIDPVTGLFSWTPTEAQAPSTNSVVIRVSDDGLPSRSDSETVTIIVGGINTAPVLAPIGNKVVRAGELLTFTALATDSDLPAQALRFSVAPGAPSGAAINATSGVFSWTPSATHAGSTNMVTLRVGDSGLPPLTNAQTFAIWVLPGTQTNLTLISTGSVWRFRDTGENLGTAWKERLFNDTAWSSGPGTLGYGGSYIVTEVSQGSTSARHITTYFRRSFSVGNPAALSPLRMRVRRDDGVVVYLNGVEVHRDNMPTGTINYQTLAPINMDADDELTYFAAPPIPSSLLVPGDNVLAVELHQKSTGSSDISFDLELLSTISVLPPSIVAHPESHAILEGQSATFNVIAVGSAPLRYQWRFNGDPIPGATNTSLTIPAAQLSAAGNYTVRVTNSAGTAISQPGVLAIEAIRGVSFVLADAIGSTGQDALVPLRITGFTNISLFQFSLHWDASVAALIGIEQLLLTNAVFGTTETNNGIMPVSWDHVGGESVSLISGTNLFFLRFRLVGPPGSTTDLSITSSPAAIEVADHNLEMVPVSVAHGSLTVALPAGVPPLPIEPIMGISLVDGSVSLWWSAQTGKRYLLQGSDDLSPESWVDLGEIVASSEIAAAVDAGPLAGQRLYRVVVLE